MEQQLLSIEIDHELVERIIVDQIKQKMKDLDSQKIFLTMEDLEHITGCSKGFIRDKILYDKRFARIRRKVGRKWLFPADETKNFLIEWIKEQPSD